jgi:hypothetical protein
MSVRSWQNTLVDAFIHAVERQDRHDVEMTAHNLAVHIAHTRNSFETLRQVLVDGAGLDPVRASGKASEEEKDTATMFWEKIREHGVAGSISHDDQEYAQIPWPVKDCD